VNWLLDHDRWTMSEPAANNKEQKDKAMTATELQQQVTILEEQIAGAERDSKEHLQRSRECDARRQELKAALASLQQRVTEALRTQAIQKSADAAEKALAVAEQCKTEAQAVVTALQLKEKQLDELLAKAAAAAAPAE
jgi:hypothetical protein